MTRSKLILGLSALFLAGAGAFASTAAKTTQHVYFLNAQNVTESTDINFSCVIGDATCIGETGASEGKQLYADQARTQELERQ